MKWVDIILAILLTCCQGCFLERAVRHELDRGAEKMIDRALEKQVEEFAARTVVSLVRKWWPAVGTPVAGYFVAKFGLMAHYRKKNGNGLVDKKALS